MTVDYLRDTLKELGFICVEEQSDDDELSCLRMTYYDMALRVMTVNVDDTGVSMRISQSIAMEGATVTIESEFLSCSFKDGLDLLQMFRDFRDYASKADEYAEQYKPSRTMFQTADTMYDRLFNMQNKEEQ